MNITEDHLDCIEKAAIRIYNGSLDAQTVNEILTGLSDLIIAVRCFNADQQSCRLCNKGFPVIAEHYGTQSLGMIPTTRCERLTNEND